MEHEKREGGAEQDDGQVTLSRSVVRNVSAALFASLWNGLMHLKSVFLRDVWNVNCGMLTCGYGSSTLFVSPPIRLTSRVSISDRNKIFYQVRFDNSTLNFSSEWSVSRGDDVK